MEHFGHVMMLHAAPKITAIMDAPQTENVSQLRFSFLGLLNSDGHFIPNLVTLLKSVHDMSHRSGEFVKGVREADATRVSDSLQFTSTCHTSQFAFPLAIVA